MFEEVGLIKVKKVVEEDFVMRVIFNLYDCLRSSLTSCIYGYHINQLHAMSWGVGWVYRVPEF